VYGEVELNHKEPRVVFERLSLACL